MCKILSKIYLYLFMLLVLSSVLHSYISKMKNSTQLFFFLNIFFSLKCNFINLLITLVPFFGFGVMSDVLSVQKKKKKINFSLDLEFENQTVLSSSGIIISNSNVCSPFQSSLLEFPTFQVWV